MNAKQFKSYLNELFGELLVEFKEDDEYGFCNFTLDNYTRIGYATNLTPEIVLQAAEKNVDLIVTHHDAWDFVYGMKEKCVELLDVHHIAHCYIHLPLDYIEFGTCNSLLELLGVNHIVQQSRHVEGDSAIGIGELPELVSLEELVGTMSAVLGEKVYFQKNSNKEIRRIAMITGAGIEMNQLREAMNSDCDVYITGEKTLYTIQYAKFINMNLIVGSHTYTEIFGVRSLAQKLKGKFNSIEILQLQEEHNEVTD
ncbi:Nif3-like dinuclear metal center hexameric protein [Paenibacillus sp. N1-5-1-14]|uniref:Nif3-like dinuclear metal center hexameric protein n=1 Tax=Paenibacillus radicibacter TaxID=2972488 RepID=UPI002158DC79|nr:Nif3-like dinuclear metal center hexameric protein [Paenibacillus radicibacter]MCR8645485.1 Nif3-like dinuclear metal center hexameric protein [Paenibacillus radicibacter]